MKVVRTFLAWVMATLVVISFASPALAADGEGFWDKAKVIVDGAREVAINGAADVLNIEAAKKLQHEAECQPIAQEALGKLETAWKTSTPLVSLGPPGYRLYFVWLVFSVFMLARAWVNHNAKDGQTWQTGMFKVVGLTLVTAAALHAPMWSAELRAEAGSAFDQFTEQCSEFDPVDLATKKTLLEDGVKEVLGDKVKDTASFGLSKWHHITLMWLMDNFEDYPQQAWWGSLIMAFLLLVVHRKWWLAIPAVLKTGGVRAFGQHIFSVRAAAATLTAPGTAQEKNSPTLDEPAGTNASVTQELEVPTRVFQGWELE